MSSVTYSSGLLNLKGVPGTHGLESVGPMCSWPQAPIFSTGTSCEDNLIGDQILKPAVLDASLDD